MEPTRVSFTAAVGACSEWEQARVSHFYSARSSGQPFLLRTEFGGCEPPPKKITINIINK